MEGEQPYLGDLLTMVLNRLLNGMILQVRVWETCSKPIKESEKKSKVANPVELLLMVQKSPAITTWDGAKTLVNKGITYQPQLVSRSFFHQHYFLLWDAYEISVLMYWLVVPSWKLFTLWGDTLLALFKTFRDENAVSFETLQCIENFMIHPGMITWWVIGPFADVSWRSQSVLSIQGPFPWPMKIIFISSWRGSFFGHWTSPIAMKKPNAALVYSSSTRNASIGCCHIFHKR